MRGATATAARAPRAALLAVLACALLAAPSAVDARSPGQRSADRGAVLYKSGDFPGAREAFAEAVQLDPGHVSAWEGLGWAEYRLGRSAEALRIWNRLLRLDPDRASTRAAIATVEREQERQARADAQERQARADAQERPPPPEARERPRGPLEQGDEAYAAGDYAEAEQAYRRALQERPGDARFLGKLGWAVRKGGRLDDAIALWREARLQPGYPSQIDRYLADAYLERGQLDDARAMYRFALQTTPRDDPAALLDLADVALRVEDPAGAERALAALFATPDLDASWAVRAAQLFVRHRSAARAVAFFDGEAVRDEVAGKSRALAIALTQAGSDALHAGRPGEAIQALSRALTLDAQSRTVLRNLGRAYLQGGRFDDAEETWKRYALAYPRLVEPHNLLANLYLDRQEYSQALAESQAVLALEPQHKGALVAGVRALFGLSRIREGLPLASDLATRYPDDAQVQRLYAQALTASREFGAAARRWRRVLELDPRSPAVKQNWVRAAYDAGDADEAVQAARRFAAAGEATPAVLQLLAEDALARKDPREAARWYRELTRREPERLVYWRSTLQLLDAQGRFDEQVAVAREALRRHPQRSELELDLATALGNAGRLDEAIARTQRFLATFPDNRAAFESLVGLLERAGRPSEALDVLARNPPSFYKEYEQRMVEARLRSKTVGIPAAMSILQTIAEPPPDERFVPILLYHGVVDHPRTLQVSTKNFESQMAALARSGYQAITLTELGRMVDGKLPFPRRPILITFDDARSDSFAFGDPILEKYGLKATMFVPTGRIAGEDAFHAGWGTLAQYASTGRWDLQAHGRDAHNPVQIDAEGHTGEFLAYRAWLPAEHRPETFAEYLRRVDDDYEACKVALEERIPGHRVVAYAYPLNQVALAQRSDDDRMPHLNESVAGRYFRFGAVQDEDGYNAFHVGKNAPFMLRRFETPGDWDGEQLLAHLARHEPRRAAWLEMARLTVEDGRPEAARDLVERIASEEPLVAPEAERLLAQIAASEGRPREAAAHLAASPPSAPFNGEPRRDTLANRLAWRNDPGGGGQASFVGDSDRRSVYSSGATFHASLAPQLELDLGGGVIRMAEADVKPLDGLQLNAGMSMGLGHRVDVSGWGRYRRFSPAVESVNGGFALRLRAERHAFLIHWTYEDVDTVLAELKGIQDHDFSVGWEYESPGWHADASAARLLFEDGNWRNDLHAAALHLFGSDLRLGLGASVDYEDSLFAPREYYAPLKLAQLMARASLSYGWSDSSSLGLEGGLGVARDAVHGSRPSGLARLRFSRWWGSAAKLGTTFAVEAKALPGYQSLGVALRLEGRF